MDVFSLGMYSLGTSALRLDAQTFELSMVTLHPNLLDVAIGAMWRIATMFAGLYE
jgi:hypothetical protein